MLIKFSLSVNKSFIKVV